MILSLKDIIDLDFLLGLDEDPENIDTNVIASRDRDIFRRIKDGHRLDDAGLISGWLIGYVVMQFGSYKMPLIFMAVCSLVAAVVSSPAFMKDPLKKLTHRSAVSA